MTQAATRPSGQPAVAIGDNRLRQVRSFIEQAEQVQPDIMGLLVSGLRGRLFWGSLAGVILGVLGALTAYLAVSPLYQSQGLMRIVAREAKILYTDSDDARLRLFDAFMAAEVTYLSSRPVLDRALEIVRIKPVGHLPRDVGELAQSVQVQGLKGLVTITAQSPENRTAATLVNAILDAYAELRLQQVEGQQSFRTKELATREASLLGQLQTLDRRILEVGQEYGQDAIANAHVNKISQLDEVGSRIDELTTTINQLETVGYTVDADSGDSEIKRAMLLDNSMASMTYDRAKKAAEAASLEKRYRPDNPKVIAAKAEIEVLDRAIDDRRAQIATLGRTGALTQRDQKKEQSVDELRALLEKLKARHRDLEAEARDLNSRIVELGYLKEERLQARERLDETRRVLEEVRVESRNSSPGVTEVVSRGSVPDRAFQDKRKPMALAGFFGGFLMSFGFVAAWGVVRPSIRHESDIATLGRSAVAAGVLDRPEAAVHQLRNSVHMALSRQEPDKGQVISVMGAVSGQGTTTLARSLAESFRHSGSRTALVDGHLARPSLTANFSATGKDGLADWITGERDAVLPSLAMDGLTFLPAGKSREDGDHSFSLPVIRELVSGLADTHDIVVADCGVANASLAPSLFAAHSDAVLLVLRHGISRRQASRAVTAAVTASRKQVLIVLTGEREQPVPEWAHGLLGIARNTFGRAAGGLARMQHGWRKSNG